MYGAPYKMYGASYILYVAANTLVGQLGILALKSTNQPELGSKRPLSSRSCSSSMMQTIRLVHNTEVLVSTIGTASENYEGMDIVEIVPRAQSS